MKLFLLEWGRLVGRTGTAGLAAALVVGVGVGLGSDALRDWILPSDRLEETFQLLWVPCALIGLVVFGWDEAFGSQEFVLHRSVGRGRLARARLAIGGVLALGLVTGAVLLPALLRAPFDPDGALFPWGELPERLLDYSWCASAFAAGAFAATLRGTPLARVLAGGAALLAVAWSTRLLFQPDLDAWWRPRAAFVLVQVGWTALLLPAALRNVLTTNDPERALPWGRAVAQVVAVAVAATFLASAFAGTFQRAALRRLYASFPAVARLEDGSFALYTRRDRQAQRIDAEHRPVRLAAEDYAAFLAALDATEDVWSPGSVWAAAQRPVWDREQPQRMHFDTPLSLGSRWEPVGWSDARQRVYLERRAGRLHAFHLADPRFPDRPPLHRVLGPDGGSFGRAVEVVGAPGPLGGMWDHLLLGDPGDGSLWRLGLGVRRADLQRIELPGGDAYRSWTEGPVRAGVPARRDTGHPDHAVVLGERGRYVFDGETWVARTEPPAREGAAPFAVTERLHGPLELDLELRDPRDGERLFAHRYVPRTVAERGRSLLLRASTLCRPPLASLTSFLGPAPRQDREQLGFRADRLRDPLLFGRRRPLLLVAHLALTILLAERARRGLRHRGAPQRTRLLWTALVLSGGPAVFLAYALLEPALCRHGRFAVPEPTRAPLIRSSPAEVLP